MPPLLAPAAAEEDVYRAVKQLEQELELLEIQEAFVKDEMKNLKRELMRAKDEVKRIQSVPLVLGQFIELIDEFHGVVLSTAGSTYYVRIVSTLDRELLKPNASTALHRHSHAVVETLPPEADSSSASSLCFKSFAPPGKETNFRFSQSKACWSMKSPTFDMRTLVAWICRNKKSERLWSFH